jgi:hypothetical protein
MLVTLFTRIGTAKALRKPDSFSASGSAIFQRLRFTRLSVLLTWQTGATGGMRRLSPITPIADRDS